MHLRRPLDEGDAFLVRKARHALYGSGYPSADRITLLRDTDEDGVADLQVPFIENLRSPFGMALVGSTFYVANTDAVLAFRYEQGQTQISAPGKLVASLPANAPNSHWTKNLLAHPDGASLFVAVGSNSNIGELGPVAEQDRAGIWRLDLATRDLVLFAKGPAQPSRYGLALTHRYPMDRRERAGPVRQRPCAGLPGSSERRG